MDFGGIASAALGAALVASSGRGVLSWLAPGGLGSHRPRELPATLAASYLLGTALAAWVAAVCGACQLRFDPWLGVAPGLALGLARLATLPAALVPRHEPVEEPPTLLARGLVLAAFLGVLAAGLTASLDPRFGETSLAAQELLSRGESRSLDETTAPAGGAVATPPLVPVAVASIARPGGVVSEPALRLHALAVLLAALALVEHALRTARRAPVWRAAALVVLAAALAPAAGGDDGDLTAAAFAALALAGTVAWTRRADARGLALAALAAGALPLVQASGFVLAGALAFALAASTARPSRLRAALTVAVVFVLVAGAWPLAAWLRGVPWLGERALEALASRWALGEGRALIAWIAPVWIAAGAAIGPAILGPLGLGGESGGMDGGAAARIPEAERPREDLRALVLACALLTVLVLLVIAASDSSPALLARAWSPGLFVQASPLAALLAARTFARARPRS